MVTASCPRSAISAAAASKTAALLRALRPPGRGFGVMPDPSWNWIRTLAAPTWWSVSNIRIHFRRTSLRILESTDRTQRPLRPRRVAESSRLQKFSGTSCCPAMSAEADQPKTPPAETPHYHGHRARLRERFQNAGPDALSDYELLEMVLFAAQPRRDMKPLAKALLKAFGSFAEAVHAPEARLREIDGMGDASVHQLKLIAAAAYRI